MLYKYLPPEAADFALTESGLSIRTSQASSLNDPFELNHTKEELIDFMENVDRNSLINAFNITQDSTLMILDQYMKYERESQYKSIEELFSNNIDKTHGILSLSRNRNSRPMWAYYSKDHTGFLIALKNKKSNDGSQTVGNIAFQKVKYSSKRPSYSMEDEINSSLRDNLFQKDIAWKHECESRSIVSITKKNTLNTDLKGYPIICHNFEPCHISYVVLGARSSNTLKRKVKNWINFATPKTQLYIAVPSRTDYKLDYIKLST